MSKKVFFVHDAFPMTWHLWRIHLNGFTFLSVCIGFPSGWNLNLSLDACKEC